MSVNPSTIVHKERPVCPVCKTCFTISDSGIFQYRAKCPMILRCGHTVCTMCLRLATRNRRQLCCPTCREVTELPDENSYKSLPVNYYLVGSVFANASLDIDTRFNVKLRRYSQSTLGPTKAACSSKIEICYECAENEADVACIDCGLSFCQQCYAKSHDENESVLGHRPWPIIPISKKQSSQQCAEHDTEKMYYCNTDDMLVCPHCTATGAHNGHNVVLIREKNKTFEERAKAAVEAACNVGRCLTHSEKTLKKLTNAIEVKSQKTAMEIHTQFCDLHAILELRERELIKDVQRGIEEKAKLINQAIQAMGSNRQRLKALISGSEERLSSNSEILSPEWLKRVLEIRELPCFVEMPEEEMSRRVDRIISKPDLDSSFLSKHSFLCQMPSGTTDSIFDIKKIGDVAADALEISSEDDALDEQEATEEYLSMPELESISVRSLDLDDSAVDDTRSECSKTSRVSEKREKPKKDPLQLATILNVKPINWTPMKTEIVEVVHTVNPTHFYVQRNVDSAICSELSKCIKHWCRKANKENTTVDSIQIGDLCLAYSKDYKAYFRARISKILNHPKGGTVGQRFKVKVFFIDYGNTEVVHQDRLQRIPEEFTVASGLAIKCSLGEIDPADKEMGWNREAINLFTRFTKNILVMLTVREFVSDTLYVDIGGCKMPCKTPCSVREALIFMGHGCFARKPDDSSEVLPPADTKFEKYGEPELPATGTTVTVLVSHVDSPDHFYIQLSENGRKLSKIVEEMKENYRENQSRSDRMDLLLWGPSKGMVCAARFHDGRWYRAEVLAVKDDRKVEVHYVDFGNAEVVDYTWVKQLFPRLLKWPKMAIECRLNHVKPQLADGGEEDPPGETRKWSDEAKLYFHENSVDKAMRARIEDVFDGALLVALYTSDRFKICLNVELVVRGYAVTSEVNTLEKGVAEATERDERVAPPVASAKNEDSEVGVCKTTLIVSLSHIVSPDEMYAQFLGSCPDLEIMSKALQDAYKNTESVDNPWSCNDLCAVFNSEKQCWCRGRIQALCGEDAAEVHLVDYGNTLTEKMDQIRVLQEEFQRNPGFAFRCHLVGVLAPGGGSKWPFVAIECLKELAGKFKPIYMKRMGKPDNGMPVHAFGKEIKKPGPLEPIKEICVSFTEELVERGLALPAQRRSRTKPVTADDLRGEEALPIAVSPDGFNLETLSVAESAESLTSDQSGCVAAATALPQQELNAPEKRWKPPQPGLKIGQKFTAIPTHVTYGGEICLHDKDKNSSTLDYISFALKEKYEGTQPQSHDLYWYKGQMCIAQFEMDACWYRARVVKVDKGMVTVHFIDYGNEEMVHPGQLRKEVITESAAQQGFCCDLYGIVPASEDGVWTRNALDFLHLLICEKPCEAVVMALPKGENPKISLSLIADEKVENTMVELGYAVRVEVECQEELDAFVVQEEPSEEQQQQQQQAAYKDLDPVPIGENFNAIVCEILGPNTFYAQRTKSEEDEPSEYQAEINRHCDELLRYSERMNAEADEWPAAAHARVGQACCARYGDGSWFRAVVVERQPADGTVSVFYVDHGNLELLTADRLRMLPSELLELPKQAVKCQLHQVAPVDEWNDEVDASFRSIYERAEPFYAVAKNDGPPLQVDLLIHNAACDKMELAYQSLVDSNLIKLVIEKKQSL